jgi:hypothetical protein
MPPVLAGAEFEVHGFRLNSSTIFTDAQAVKAKIECAAQDD